MPEGVEVSTGRELQIRINAGETTCATEPGNFCIFFCTRKFGGVWFCYLFSKKLYDEDGGLTGWLQRCPECLAAEVK